MGMWKLCNRRNEHVLLELMRWTQSVEMSEEKSKYWFKYKGVKSIQKLSTLLQTGFFKHPFTSVC